MSQKKASKIPAIIGAILAVLIPAVATVTVPEIRSLVGFNRSESNKSKQEVDLTVQDYSGQPLSDVSVEFKSKGAPENIFTDSNGYVKINIPQTTNVQVTLRKEGYQQASYTIDLQKDPSLTRTYRLSKISTPDPPISSPPLIEEENPPPKDPTKAECINFGTEPEQYTQLISVANKTEKSQSRFNLSQNSRRELTCQIIKNSGELPLPYALSDNSSINRIEIQVYVDGNLRKTIKLSRGEVLKEKIDIRGAESYKLIFSIVSQQQGYFFGDYVYVLDN
jgi:uncharacterized membrane protein